MQAKGLTLRIGVIRDKKGPPSLKLQNMTSREAAAELQPSAPLGLGYRRVPNPALTRWVILSRRFAALGKGATVETGRIVALAKR